MTKIPAIISSIKTMHDNTLRLEVDTQELTPEAKAELFNLHNQYGVFVYSVQDIKENDLDELPIIKIEKHKKSPSQRFRAVLYRIWQNEGQQGAFEDYYKSRMEQLISHYKEKL